MTLFLNASSARAKVWKVSDDGGTIGGTPSGWTDPGFDDSGWEDPDTTTEIQSIDAVPPSLQIYPHDAITDTHVQGLVWLARIPFSLTGAPTVATLYLGFDDSADFYINGTLVHSGAIAAGYSNTTPHDVSSAPFVIGENILAVQITNLHGAHWIGNPTWVEYRLFSDIPLEPTPGVGVDWDDDGFSTDDDLSGDVESWRIQRGASPEVTGGATIGTATVTLNNRSDDRYNPLNAAGALYGRLRDGKPIWIGVNSDGAISGGDPRGLFGGRTTNITPMPVPGSSYSPKVVIEAEDALGWYDRTPVRVADEIGRSYGALRQALLDDAGETRTDLAHEILTMPLSSFDGNLLDGLEAINKVNGTRHFCKPENDRTDWYTYTTRNRQWRLDATVDASLDGAGDALTTDGWKLSADTVTNQQKATVSPVSFTPSSTVVWKAEGLPYSVTSAADRVIWVEFDDFVDSPVATANYTGTAPTVTLLPFGNTAKLTIHSSGTTVITGLLVAGALAKRGNSVSALVDDTASQAGTRGIRAGSEISGDLVGVLANAQGIAAHIVWRYADPQFRPTATVVNWIPEQFEIDMFDIVSITVAELQMTSRLFEVIGLTHDCTTAASSTVKSHTTTYVLQECAVQSDPGWFVLDTSELDSADILAY